MNKIKMFFSKINKDMWLYLTIIIITVLIMHFSLKVLNLKFRNWVYINTIIIVILGILIKALQKFIKQPPKVKGAIGIFICILVFLGTIFSKITLMLLFVILLGASNIVPSAEHVIERDGIKYIASVHSRFLNTDVDYYKYVNFLVMGNKAIDTEYYKGSYDPIKRQLEREKENREIIMKNENANNTVIESSQNTTKQEIIKKEEIIEDKDIIFTQEINNITSIRVIDRGNILGQRKIIQIQKTTDNGETWKNTLKTSDESMTVNEGAKFFFINDKVRFY